jgi:hypothetical protein
LCRKNFEQKNLEGKFLLRIFHVFGEVFCGGEIIKKVLKRNGNLIGDEMGSLRRNGVSCCWE